MADVRALLAAERQARRITHPHLTYTKSGMLICTVCNLNVKSEALWEGHLKSANHRRNAAQAAAQENANVNIGTNAGKGVKRKIEDVEDDDDDAPRERDLAEIDARKKPKSRPESINVVGDKGEGSIHAQVLPPQNEDHDGAAKQSTPIASATESAPPTNGSTQPPAVDEDEWAAFEREVAPLATAQPDYASAATIVAAPVTTAQLQAQEEEDKRRKLETEADDEKEDEERRIEEEFDVMEEMEERVRKLREKRDALRSGIKAGTDMGQDIKSISADTAGQDAADSRAGTLHGTGEEEDEKEEEEEEEDEWYS
ncbi:hypothetical protein AYL99_01214 [Fonsecaea erecta]|uniref:Zinc finger double-stranded RNA binding domain-containing protein n=1 Tax=Fonsecaea erecta TaxID=1367422 RepID=A0A178ZZS4_9EURO|nr:hypothetical protein AYL99_01214 [Fonsecaea erecta]OAP65242.1 hypothetical protein AYL99_01214 [Fonsecaea erecta]